MNCDTHSNPNTTRKVLHKVFTRKLKYKINVLFRIIGTAHIKHILPIWCRKMEKFPENSQVWYSKYRLYEKTLHWYYCFVFNGQKSWSKAGGSTQNFDTKAAEHVGSKTHKKLSCVTCQEHHLSVSSTFQTI